MTLVRSIPLAAGAILMFAASNARGQDYNYDYTPASANYYSQLFSSEELDNLVAPVALYPDPILAQIFIAATFADQVDIAARHVRLFGTDNVDYQPWDVSVKAVAHYPPVLYMLSDRTDWTAALGQAYAYQSNDLMDAVQRLRWMAQSQGNLVTTDYHQVVVERQYIRIVPAHPRVIYVPVYDPYAIYYRRAVFSAGIHTRYWSFGVSFPIGSWLNYDCDWGGRRIYYDGWRGHGWRTASRPYINVVNIYVNPRYETVNINRTIINRNVNYVTLNNTYNTVHKNAKFDSYDRNVRVARTAVSTAGRGASGAVAGGAQRGGGGAVSGGAQRGGGSSVVASGGQRGGNDAAQGGRAMGRGASPQQGQSRGATGQSAAIPQGGQRTAIPSGSAQPVQRQQQSPVIQQRQQQPSAGGQQPQNGQAQQGGRGAANGRGQTAQRPAQQQPQQQPQVIERQPTQQGNAPSQRTAIPGNGRGGGQSAQRTAPAQVNRQPVVTQRQSPSVQQQRQAPTVQQRQAPSAQQQRQAPVVQQRPQQQQQARSQQPSTVKAQPRSAPAQSNAPAAAARGNSGGGGNGQAAQRSASNGKAKGRG